jgi:hypothetical protein
MVIRSRAFD